MTFTRIEYPTVIRILCTETPFYTKSVSIIEYFYKGLFRNSYNFDVLSELIKEEV